MANTAFDHVPALQVPGSTTTNGLVTWDANDGGGFLSSSVVLSTGGALSTLTSLVVDTLTIDGSAITTTASNNPINLTPNGTGAVVISKTSTPILLLTNSANSNAITLNTGTTAANYTITMPTAAPTAADKVLKTSGSSPYAQLVWGDAGGGGDLSFGGDTFGADKVIGSNDAYALSFETAGVVRMRIEGAAGSYHAAGAITMPTQPAVLAYNSSTDPNVTGTNGLVPVDFDAEVYDRNGDFTGDTFQAPVAGIYHVSFSILIDEVTSSCTTLTAWIDASNRNAYGYNNNPPGGNQLLVGSIDIDMDAGDTVHIDVAGNGESSARHDIQGGAAGDRTLLSVRLVA